MIDKENLNIVEYKYRMGAYSLQMLVNKVENGELTQDQFFSVTRKKYKGFRQIQEMDLEKAKEGF